MVKRKDAEAELQLPPGFRFFPTDEELVVHYLCKKTSLQSLPVPIIAEVDLYKYDPWQLPDKALFGEKEWYFFTPRDRKYPNGSRPNRAAGSGYWKATGADKPITAKTGKKKVGIKKALVFYAGKAPRGTKTNWIMHEYRLAEANRPTRKKGSLRLDDWVLCRIYNKKNSAEKVAVEQQENNPQQPTSASVDDSIIHEHVKTSLSDPSRMEIEIPKIAASSPLMNMNLSINPESTVATFSNNFRKLPPIQAMEGFCSQQWGNYAPRPHSDSSSSKPSSPDFVSEREEVQSNFKWTNLHQQDQPHHQHNNQTQQTLFPFGIEGLSNPLLPLEGFSMPADCCQEYMNNFTTSSDCLSKFYSNDVLFQ